MNRHELFAVACAVGNLASSLAPLFPGRSAMPEESPPVSSKQRGWWPPLQRPWTPPRMSSYVFSLCHIFEDAV